MPPAKRESEEERLVRVFHSPLHEFRRAQRRVKIEIEVDYLLLERLPVCLLFTVISPAFPLSARITQNR
jgi:hypothetical protein